MSAKIFALATQKGGVGKSTSAIELASILSLEYGYKVLIVDFDGQCNTSMYLGINKSAISSYDILENNELTKEAIISLKNIDIIPGSTKLSNVSKDYLGDSSAVFILDDALTTIKDDYDYIVIDNGPQRDLQMQMVYATADYIICPTNADEGGVKGIINVYEDINKLKNARVPLSNAKIVCALLTRYKNENVHKAVWEFLNSEMNKIDPTIKTFTIPELKEAGEAKLFKKSIIEHAPYTGISFAYKKVVNELLESIKED